MWRYATGVPSMAGHGCRDLFRRLSPAIALAFALAAVTPVLARAAEKCSVDADGAGAYERVQARIREKLVKVGDINFPAIGDIEVAMSPGCVFVLKGRFVVRQRGQMKPRSFNAKLTRKSGAPMGWKILKLMIGNG